MGKCIKSLVESEKYKKIMLSNQVFNKVNESRKLSANQRYDFILFTLQVQRIIRRKWLKDVECFKNK